MKSYSSNNNHNHSQDRERESRLAKTSAWRGRAQDVFGHLSRAQASLQPPSNTHHPPRRRKQVLVNQINTDPHGRAQSVPVDDTVVLLRAHKLKKTLQPSQNPSTPSQRVARPRAKKTHKRDEKETLSWGCVRAHACMRQAPFQRTISRAHLHQMARC